MPVSESLSCAFIHVRKVAGTSIVRVLEAADPQLDLNDKGLWDILCAHPERRWLVAELRRLYPLNALVDFPQWHLPATIVRKLVGQRQWDRLFSFAFVRNPWDSVVSAYHFERWYTLQPHVAANERDRAEALHRCNDFERFVKLYPLLEPPDMTSMIADERGNVLVDFVGRFENLDADFRTICRKIGIEAQALPHENSSANRRDYRSYYTDETRALVGRYFARDVERFGYEF